MSRKKILIVDDSRINRKILAQLLSTDYIVFEAENGEKALEILAHEYQQISCIILDLLMPVMSGREFLQVFSAQREYTNIPVLVATADRQQAIEKECLELGAWDFVAKPYDKTILKLRLQNIISRSQLNAMTQIRHAAEHDTLTGLYNRTMFFSATRAMLDEHPAYEFTFVRMDVDRFRLFNSFFGETEGDNLLRYITKALEKQVATLPLCTYGRIESDVFVLCAPLDDAGIRQLVDGMVAVLAQYNSSYYIEPSFGIYPVRNSALPIDIMYSCASLAAAQ